MALVRPPVDKTRVKMLVALNVLRRQLNEEHGDTHYSYTSDTVIVCDFCRGGFSSFDMMREIKFSEDEVDAAQQILLDDPDTASIALYGLSDSYKICLPCLKRYFNLSL